MQVPLPVLLALSPGDLREQDARPFLGRLERAVAGGLAALLLREPGLSDRAYLELGARVRALVRTLVVHDRGHLAARLGADALQLGFRSLPPSAVSAGIPVGFSAHAQDTPEARAGADFLLLGPVLATPSKAGLVEALGFAGLARECARETRPIWAIGGLKPEHAREARSAGARGMAVLSGVLGADDPERAARGYLDAWGPP